MMAGTGGRPPRVGEVMKPYVCPKCFEPSSEPDRRGNCPACGHSTDGSSILLWLSLAVVLGALLLFAFWAAFAGYRS
jgi:hypothetical protein